jgi:hypothetical protein
MQRVNISSNVKIDNFKCPGCSELVDISGKIPWEDPFIRFVEEFDCPSCNLSIKLSFKGEF